MAKLIDALPREVNTLIVRRCWKLTREAEADLLRLAITLEDRLIGVISIEQDEIGYWLAEAYWGRGVVARVAAALAERAFANPEVSRVFAPIHAHNAASMRVAEKAGLVREGVQPQSAIKAGRVIDRVVYARYREARS